MKVRKKCKNTTRLPFGSGYWGLSLTICGGDANLARLWFGI